MAYFKRSSLVELVQDDSLPDFLDEENNMYPEPEAEFTLEEFLGVQGEEEQARVEDQSECREPRFASQPVRGTRSGRGTRVKGSEGCGSSRARGANWRENESLALIELKRKEYETRHSRASHADTFKFGKVAWSEITSSLNALPRFKQRTSQQIQTRWDTIRKEYRNLRLYLGSSGAAGYWSLPLDKRKELSKAKRFSIDFSHAMYEAMDCWYGKRQIFGQSSNIIDTGRPHTINVDFGRKRTSNVECSPSISGISTEEFEDMLANSVEISSQERVMFGTQPIYQPEPETASRHATSSDHMRPTSSNLMQPSPRQVQAQVSVTDSTGHKQKASCQTDTDNLVKEIANTNVAMFEHMEDHKEMTKQFYDLEVSKEHRLIELEKMKHEHVQSLLQLEVLKGEKRDSYNESSLNKMERITRAMESMAFAMLELTRQTSHPS